MLEGTGTSLEGRPPDVLFGRRFTVKGGRFCLWIYAVPVSENCTRLIINAGGNFPKPQAQPGLKGLKARFSPQPLIRTLLRNLRCTLTTCHTAFFLGSSAQRCKRLPENLRI